MVALAPGTPMKVITALFSLALPLLAASSVAGQACGVHDAPGIAGGGGEQILCRDGYALNYDYDRQSALWVSYQLTRASVFSDAADRKGMNFRLDREIDSDYRAPASIYSKSGYDKGHLAPAASVDYSEEALRETFLYSNALPMLPGFNRHGFGYDGAWGALEDSVRDWVKERDRLWVVSGPVYLHDMGLLAGELPIPSHFFKVIADPDEQSVTAYLLPHENNTAPALSSYRETVDCLEALTGLDFMSQWSFAQDLENSVGETGWSDSDGDTSPGGCVSDTAQAYLESVSGR